MGKVIGSVFSLLLPILSIGASAFGGPLGGMLVSLGGALIMSALAPKPKTPDKGLTAVPEPTRDRMQIIRSSVATRVICYGRARLSGPLVFAGSSGDKNQYLHLIIAMCEGPIDSVEEVYIKDEPYTSATYSAKTTMDWKLGTTDQVAFQALIDAIPTKWTSAHRLQGVACLYARLEWDQNVWVDGVPQISALIKGRKVYDPRTDTDVWSNNPALCILDYLQARYGLEIPDSEVDLATFVAAANACDEEVELEDGSTQKRYTCDGLLDTGENPHNNLLALLSSCVGDLVWSGGKFQLFVGIAISPSFDLTEDHLAGPMKVRPTTGRSQLFNAVRGTFHDERQKWIPTDFPAVKNAFYKAEDNNIELFKDIELPMTTDPVRAQRIAKIHLEKARQALTVEAMFKPSVLSIATAAAVTFTSPTMGWDRKLFRVKGWSVGQRLEVNLILQEEAPESYDWNAGEETVNDPAPNTGLPNPFQSLPVTNLILESGDDALLLAGDGTIISRIIVSWSEPEWAFVSAYEVQYKLSAEADYASVMIGPTQTQHIIAPVKDGDLYDVRVRSITIMGIQSEWTGQTAYRVVGKAEPPPKVQLFVVQQQPDGTRQFSWNTTTQPADVRAGGGYLIRYSSDMGDEWDDMIPLHDGILVSAPWETNQLGAGDYLFAIRAVDSTGNQSSETNYIEASLGDPRLRGVLLARYEHMLLPEPWPGIKTDCFVDEVTNWLYGIGTDTWDDLPSTWDALPATWDEMSPSVSEFAYQSPVIDVGADVRVNPVVSVVVDGGTAVVQMATGMESDGTVIGARVPLGIFVGRYIQIHVNVTGANAILKQMTILLDGEVVIDEFNDIDTFTYTGPWFERIAAGHFKMSSRGSLAYITTATITALQNVGTGWTWELISKTEDANGHEPAAEFKVYNAAGVLSDCVIDLELKGPRG